MQIFAFHGDLQAVLQGPPKLAAKPSRDGRVATVYIEGILSRTGENGTSTDKVTVDINALAADPGVSAIELLITSPGGKVPGTAEMATAVANAAKQKYVAAYIQDIGASGAYWVASGATRIFSDPLALVGSIGTYSVLIDTSSLANQLGAKVHVIRAGRYKGAGVPGSPVTDDHLADVQRVVDSVNSHFLASVAAGRKLPLASVQELADGRVHVGQEATRLGLIDGVLSYDSFRSQLQAAFSQSSTQSKGSLMFSKEKQPGTASENFWSLVEDKIKAGLPRDRAIERTVIAESDLHQAMLRETQEAR